MLLQFLVIAGAVCVGVFVALVLRDLLEGVLRGLWPHLYER